MVEEGCDVDDVLCQLETLRHLRGLRQEIGKESFQNRFPEFVGLEDKITDEITSQEGSLNEVLERCQQANNERWAPFDSSLVGAEEPEEQEGE